MLWGVIIIYDHFAHAITPQYHHQEQGDLSEGSIRSEHV